MSAERPLFSLILATYGRSDDIGRLVDSLADQEEQRFELLVVDQNGDERVAPYVEQARAAGLTVSHLRMARPNLSSARNAGLAAARGEWVAFPDDDCWYEPGLLAAIARGASSDEGLQGLVAEWVEREEVHPQDQSGHDLTLAAWRRYRGGDASSISLFIRTELVRQVGGFDERMGVGQWYGAGEEIDLIMSLLGRGARFRRVQEAQVHHAFSASPGDVPVRSVWRQSLSRARGTGAIYAKQGLALPTILRGLAAPLVRGLLSGRISSFVGGLATSYGRWQGWRTWPSRAERP